MVGPTGGPVTPLPCGCHLLSCGLHPGGPASGGRVQPAPLAPRKPISALHRHHLKEHGTAFSRMPLGMRIERECQEMGAVSLVTEDSRVSY